MVRQLFYVSVASDRLTQQDIQDILNASRQKNARRDITGCLLYVGGTFAQVLEGEAAAVTALAERIGRDDRHFDIRILVERDVTQRAYGSWSMGFVYDLRLEDDVHALLNEDVSSENSLHVMSRMRPDTVMGAL